MKKLLLLLLLSFGFSGLANADKNSVLASECSQQLKDMSDFFVETGLSNGHPYFDLIPQKLKKVKYSSSYTLTGTRGNSLLDGIDNGYCEWFGTTFPEYEPLYQTNSNHKYTCHSKGVTAIKIEMIGTNRFNEKRIGTFECAFIGGNYILDAIKVSIESFWKGCESCQRTL